jgi:hypothetical protein
LEKNRIFKEHFSKLNDIKYNDEIYNIAIIIEQLDDLKELIIEKDSGGIALAVFML